MTPRRRGQVALSRDSIVSTALRLVDAEGTGALTMRRLGAELDVDASSLYYHVPGKSALEDLVVDAVMGEVPLEPAEKGTESVIEQVMAFVNGLAQTLLAHPRAIPLFGARSLTSPASLVPVEYLLALLHEGGLEYPDAIAAVNDIFFFVLGSTSGRSAQLFDPQHQAKAIAALRELPAGEFPHLTAAMGSPLIKKSVEFEMGARALVCGLIGEIKDEQKEPGGP
jgi:TetR/AcrR family transcriptional regulator, tetracycline repressor protein